MCANGPLTAIYLKRQNFIPDAKSVTSKKPYYPPPLGSPMVIISGREKARAFPPWTIPRTLRPRTIPPPNKDNSPPYRSKPNFKITYIHTCMHTCLHIYIHAYTQRCMHTRIYAYNTYMHAYRHIFMHTYTLRPKYSHIY